MAETKLMWCVVARVPFSPSTDYLMPSEACQISSSKETKEEAEVLAEEWRKEQERCGGLPDRHGHRNKAVITVEVDKWGNK